MFPLLFQSKASNASLNAATCSLFLCICGFVYFVFVGLCILYLWVCVFCIFHTSSASGPWDSIEISAYETNLLCAFNKYHDKYLVRYKYHIMTNVLHDNRQISPSRQLFILLVL